MKLPKTWIERPNSNLMRGKMFSPSLNSVFCNHQKNNCPAVHDRSPLYGRLLFLQASLSLLALCYFWWEEKDSGPALGSNHWTIYIPSTREQVTCLQNRASEMWRMWCEIPLTSLIGNTCCAETWAISHCASSLGAEPFLIGPHQILPLRQRSTAYPLWSWRADQSCSLVTKISALFYF